VNLKNVWHGKAKKSQGKMQTKEKNHNNTFDIGSI
jgi:hypothetical protein